jgi:outer membrane lipase/esterase
MRTKKRVLPALLLSLFAAASGPSASAASFSNVYVFGDSLSDAGYFRPFFQALTAQGFPPALVPILGRFTTNPGPVWSELVAEYYGVTPAPSNVSGGTIFAQGGARVSEVPGYVTPPGQPQRSISTQITEFLNASGGTADPNALYTVWGGANDLFVQLGQFQAGTINAAQLQANFLAVAGSEIQQIGRLQAAGGRYIAVFTLPNIGATPAFAGQPTSSAVTALSAGYNTTLLTGLQAAGIRVIPVDAFALFNQIVANPAAYGFTNTTGMACGPFPPFTSTPNSFFCYQGNLVAPNAASTYVFADSVHPTTAGHALIAQFTEQLIEAPSQYGLLAEGSVRAGASRFRAITDGLVRNKRDDLGTFGVFAGGDRTDFKIESGNGSVGTDNRIGSGTLGVTMRASESVTIGAAYSYSRDKATLGSFGSYRAGEHAWSLFGAVQWGGFYGTGVASIADITYSDVQRRIVLGPNTSFASGGTDGTNASAYFSTGYDFPLGRVLVGPTVAVTLQDVEVSGFDESGGGASGLRLAKQKRKSEVWSIGGRASMDLGAWTPWVRVTADKERRDDVRMVSATPLSLIAINSTYDVPTYSPDSTWVTSSIGANGYFGRNWAVSLSYTRIDGRSNVKEQGISGIVSYRF